MKLILAFSLLSLFATTAIPQPATEKTLRICRETTYKLAGVIFKAKRQKVDLNEVVKETLAGSHDTWYRGVIVYMFNAAIDAPSMTEHEIATLGNAYCIDRRPPGT